MPQHSRLAIERNDRRDQFGLRTIADP